MKPLLWEDYCNHFDEWSESTRASYVSRIADLESAKESDVAWIASSLYNELAASKLINKAIDAGIRFSNNDIYLFEFSVNEETLARAKNTSRKSLFGLSKSREEKKKRKEAFWNGVGEVMFVDDFIDSLFGKKHK